IKVCIASSEIASSLFLNACSISAASFIASAESPVCGVLGFGATVRVATAFNLAAVAERRAGLAAIFAAALGDGIQLVPFLQRLVFLQPHLPVGDALAGLHVVFHAVPGADEMHLVFRERQAQRRLVWAKLLFHRGDGQAFARRSALVQAEVAVGVILAFVPEHADLLIADKYD